MFERLQYLDLRVDLRLLLLTNMIHIDFAPSHFDPLLLVITLEHSLECTMPELMVELHEA